MERRVVSRCASWMLTVGVMLVSGCDIPDRTSRIVLGAAEHLLSPPAARAEAVEKDLADRICPLGEAKAETAGKLKGKRRLALVVGVGDYLSPSVPKLEGSPRDADKVFELLTDPVGGYGFPKENVCFLKNRAATRTAFKDAFQRALIDRARDGDVVVVYYAGHGAQAPDGNGDEPDNADETLMMVDARHNGEIDLVDDEFNYMLSGLFKKMSGQGKPTEQKVTVILDSCNSGSATRAVDSPLTSRFFQAPKEALDSKAGLPAPDAGGKRWDGDDLPGLVFVSAAIDGTAANEIGGEGLFTKAMIQTLRESAGKPITYSQLVLRIRQLIPSYSSMVNQRVDAQGGTFVEREVFGDSSVAKPPSYDIKEVKDTQITLVGTALPGWSAGATVRVYAWPPSPKSTTRTVSDLQDPGRAKATLVVDSINGLGAKAHLVDGTQNGSQPPTPGDVAVLAIAGKDSVTLKVRFLPAGKAGGVPEARKKRVVDAIAADKVLQQTIQVVEGLEAGPAWTLGAASSGHLQLFDPAGVLRSTYTASADTEGDKVARNLHQQARQQALMQLKGEPGDDFVNEETIQVWAEEAPPVDFDGIEKVCPKQNAGHWDKEKNGPGTHALEIPLCHSWALKVKLSESAPTSLYVGGLILSADGGIIGFPGGPDVDEQGTILLKPGQDYTYKLPLVGSPPINGEDHILVFGTREDNKVEWSRLSEPAATRGEDSGLQASLGQFLNGSTRGVMTGKARKPSTWTSSTLTLKVVANSLMTAPPDPTGKRTREYTVQKYDIREQLPANQDSALYRLLMKTYELTNRFADSDGGANGPRYNQDHEGRWEKLSDEENLAKGIDCSRSIWYSFTRAGLQYSKAGGPKNKKQLEFWPLGAYVSTAEMIDPESLRLDQIALVGEVKPSPLNAQFQSCRTETDLRPGDVLVYRRVKGQKRVDGHVVMVIDPARSIAWGSHAWDGAAPKGSPKVDTGVEYQWIKSIKKGMDSKWDAWDTGNMVMVDCWRHKQIAAEWEESPLNRSGSYDMATPLAQTGSTPSK